MNEGREILSRENITLENKYVDLTAFYQDELNVYRKQKQEIDSSSWKIIENAAKSSKISEEKTEEKNKTHEKSSLSNKIHNARLFFQAKLEGIKDLDRFQELTHYLESSVVNVQDRIVEIQKGLSEDEKNKLLEVYRNKGWYSSWYDFHEWSNDEKAALYLEKKIPLRLIASDIRNVKKLMNANSNVLEIIKDLQKTGYHLTPFILRDIKTSKKISRLCAAPHVQEALALMKEISFPEWTSTSFNLFEETELRLDFLIKIAESDNPSSSFASLDEIKKIDLVSRALNIRVNLHEIHTWKQAVKNPLCIQCAVLIVQQYPERYIRNNHFIKDMQVLDQAGLLKPLVSLQLVGISTPSFARFFSDYKEAQELVHQPEVQSLLQDNSKQEFTSLVKQLTGGNITLSQWKNLENNFHRKNEIIYLLKLLLTDSINDFEKDQNIEFILTILDQTPDVVTICTEKEFQSFFKQLKEKTGYQPTTFKFYLGTESLLKTIVKLYNQPEVWQALLEPNVCEIIKTLHPKGDFDIDNSNYYIRIAQIPHAHEIVKTLQSLVPYSPPEETVRALSQSLEKFTKLASVGVKTLVEQLAQEFEWKMNYHDINDLLTLYENTELRSKLFAQENVDFIKKIRPRCFNSLQDISVMIAVPKSTRNLLIFLAEKFSYYPQFESDGLTHSSIYDAILDNEVYRDRLYSSDFQKLFATLKAYHGFYFKKPQDIYPTNSGLQL